MLGKISVLIVGGLHDGDYVGVEILPESDSRLPRLPTLIYGSSIFQHGKDILLCGGNGNIDKCLKLDRQKYEWTYFNSMIVTRNSATVISMPSETYFLGGSGETLEATTEILEHDNFTWHLGLEIPSANLYSGCGVKISDTEFLIIGGLFSETRILKWNTQDKQWHNSSIRLPYEVSNHCCILFNKKVIVTGGTDDARNEISTTIIIDIGQEDGGLTVRKGGDMNQSRAFHGMGIITIENIPSVIAFGGVNSNVEGGRDSIEVWNDNEETWSMFNSSLKVPNYSFGFVTLPTSLISP